jgi:hypothetical protein
VLPFAVSLVAAFVIIRRMSVSALRVALGGVAAAALMFSLVGMPGGSWGHPAQYLIPFAIGCLGGWLGTRLASRRDGTRADSAVGAAAARRAWMGRLRLPVALAVLVTLAAGTYSLVEPPSSDDAIRLARRIDGGAVALSHVLPQHARDGATCRSAACTVRLVKPLVAAGADAPGRGASGALVVPESAFVPVSSTDRTVGAVGLLWVRVSDFVVPVDVRIVGAEEDRLLLVPQPAAAWVDLRPEVWRALTPGMRARFLAGRSQASASDGRGGSSIAYEGVLAVADPNEALKPGMTVRDAGEVPG